MFICRCREFSKQKAAKSKKGVEKDAEDDDEDELLEGLSDEEMEFSDDEDFQDAFGDDDDDDDDDDDEDVDFDEEDVAFSDDNGWWKI